MRDCSPMNKPLIDRIDKNTIRVKGTDIDILLKKVNGLIRFSRDISTVQLTETDAKALGIALRDL